MFPRVMLSLLRSVNPQVPGSSPGRGATEFVTDLGLSPATPAGLLFFWNRYTESPRVGIGSAFHYRKFKGVLKWVPNSKTQSKRNRTNIMGLEHIERVSSWDSGGDVTLDLIELKDGRVLAISDEIVVLYKSMEDVMTGDASEERPSMFL